MSRLLKRPFVTIAHWIVFLEAVYCFGIVGIAIGLGEGPTAAVDILFRVLFFKEGLAAAAALYAFPIFVSARYILQRRFIFFPWNN